MLKNFQLILGYLGIIFILIGLILVIPLFTLFFYPSELAYSNCFLIPSLICVLVGYCMTILFKDKTKYNLSKNEDTVIVLLLWTIAIFVCSFPFLMTGKYNFTQSFFESTSGLTSTGLSIVDINNTPKIFLMYRSILLFFGGIGLVLIVTSAISDTHGMRLYTAEGHSDKLLPNLLKSTRMIMKIYLGYIIAGIILYVIFGMKLFDAINHSIAAVSTGGFSTKPTSIGYYNSLSIELISIILMLFGSTNFYLHLLILKRKFRNYFQHCETKITFFLIAFFTPLLTFILSNFSISLIPKNIRTALFQVISAFTTTGFQTTNDFEIWSSSSLLILIILMIIGGNLGSTSGGLKQYRVYISLKSIWWTFRNKFSNSRTIYTDKVNQFGTSEQVAENSKKEIFIFIFFYLTVLLIGTFILTLFGYSLEHSMFEFSSALSTVGLSVGITSPDANPIILWTIILGMIIGRLEIFIVFLGVRKLFHFSK